MVLVRFEPAPLAAAALRWLTAHSVRIEALPAVAPRFARDRPFRAVAVSFLRHSTAFRAKMHVPSRQHQARFRLRLPRSSRRSVDGHETGLCAGRSLRAGRRKTHFVRLPSLTSLRSVRRRAVLVRDTSYRRALARAPQGRSRRRERERAAGAVGQCRRKPAMYGHRGGGA